MKTGDMNMSGQEKTKPLIEDVGIEYLDGDIRKDVLELVAWLRANKMTPAWASSTSWKASYKGTGLYYIQQHHGAWHGYTNEKSWTAVLYLNHLHEYQDTIMDEGLQKIVLDGVFYCYGCSARKPCFGGTDIKILGKDIKRACASSLFKTFIEIDKTTLVAIKKLLELEKKTRKENN